MQIITDQEIANVTTFKQYGLIKTVFYPEKYKDFKSLPSDIKILGGGSNCIFAEDVVSLPVACTSKLKRSIQFRENKCVISGNFPLPVLAKRLAYFGYSGLENFSTVPGYVSGAVVNNAGRGMNNEGFNYYLESIQVLDDNFDLKTLEMQEIKFSYRHTQLPTEVRAIVSATINLDKLIKTDPDDASKLFDKFNSKKQRTQPLSANTWGSTFKSCAEFGPAWRVLSDAGLSGQRIGGCRISPLHCNFVENLGGARASDALQIIDLMRKHLEKRGHSALQEVEVIR